MYQETRSLLISAMNKNIDLIVRVHEELEKYERNIIKTNNCFEHMRMY